jgi:hypothetical protein
VADHSSSPDRLFRPLILFPELRWPLKHYIMPSSPFFSFSIDPLRRLKHSLSRVSSPKVGDDRRKFKRKLKWSVENVEAVEEGEGVHELQVRFAHFVHFSFRS